MRVETEINQLAEVILRYCQAYKESAIFPELEQNYRNALKRLNRIKMENNAMTQNVNNAKYGHPCYDPSFDYPSDPEDSEYNHLNADRGKSREEISA